MLISRPAPGLPHLAHQLEDPFLDGEGNDDELALGPDLTSTTQIPPGGLDDDWFAGLLEATRPHSGIPSPAATREFKPDSAAISHIPDEADAWASRAIARPQDERDELFAFLDRERRLADRLPLALAL